MMLVHFGSRIEGSEAAVRLPVTAAALPGGDLGLDRLVVAIDREGQLVAEGTTMNKKTAVRWWRERGEARRKGQQIVGDGRDELPTLVVIRADRDARYGAIRSVISQAQSQGFGRFTLVVRREEEP
jgi:biopolymer transport protein ExbD